MKERRQALSDVELAEDVVAAPGPADGSRSNHPEKSEKIGAGEEIRTLDPNLGKVVLYH